MIQGSIAAVGAGTALIAGAAAGIPVFISFIGIASVSPHLLGAMHFLDGFRTVNVLEADDGLLFVRRRHIKSICLEEDDGPSGSWLLRGDSSQGSWHITGRDALIAAYLILPAFNYQGASKRSIGVAVAELDALKEPGDMFRSVVKEGSSLRVSEMPKHTLLALEIAAAEERERVPLDAELSGLEAAWRRAEEIAQIADSLLTPDTVERRLAEIRRERHSIPEGGGAPGSLTDGDQAR
jgi:hypothetical protein